MNTILDKEVLALILDTDQTSIANLKCYQRFNLVGTAGSGKSTFGRKFAKALDLPFFEMDQIFWKPDWKESDDQDFFDKIRDVTDSEAWILDGNYTRTIPIKWNRTQVVVWLDLPFLTTVYRVTKRAIHRSFSKSELWPNTGNRETLRKAFLSRESIIWWSVKHYFPNRRKYQNIMNSEEFHGLVFLRLSSQKQVTRLLEALE